MKGPHERLKYDLRRLWECPVCKRRERVAASQTFRHCSCQMKQAEGKHVVMKLIQDGVQRLTPVIAIKHERPMAVAVVVEAAPVAEAEVMASEPFDGRVEREPGTDVDDRVDPKEDPGTEF